MQESVQMASKSGAGWRGQVRIVGYPPEYKSFPKKAQAVLWEETRKAELKAGKRGEYPRKTVLEALQRFRTEEAPSHKGHRWERIRCLQFERYPLAKKLLRDITDDDMALWREERLKQVSGPTVRREMGLWSQVFECAREKWRWIPKNVMRDVKRPSASKPNPQPVPQDTIDAMVRGLGSAHKHREVALGFLLGCETAMRPWEMLRLTKDRVFWRECYAVLEDTKNGDRREVPLTPGAIEVLAELDAMNPGERFFTVAEGSATALWGETRDALGIRKLHFRHSRRVGIKRLSERLPIQELGLAIGHRNLNSLRHYYHASGAEMAQRLRPMPSPSRPSTADAPLPNDGRASGSPGETEP